MVALGEGGKEQAGGLRSGGVILGGVTPFPSPIPRERMSLHTHTHENVIYFASSVFSVRLSGGRRGHAVGM